MFPARAGMSRDTARLRRLPGDVPRASGDEPYVTLAVETSTLCSPRERG